MLMISVVFEVQMSVQQHKKNYKNKNYNKKEQQDSLVK